jgi:hypothetical protein
MSALPQTLTHFSGNRCISINIKNVVLVVVVIVVVTVIVATLVA